MPPEDSSELLYFNGVNGSTGEYLLPPLSPHDVANIARGEEFDVKHLQELRDKKESMNEQDLGPVEGVDPTKIEEAGWGVIFAENLDPAVREALRDLLRLRKSQATRLREHHYREFTHRLNTSSHSFLVENGAGPGPADPNRIPYYLLIVGDPEAIPYRFQYRLDVQYAVGRIWFETPEEYANYARNVVAAETEVPPMERRAVFFGVQNSDDQATLLSSTQLVGPLAEQLSAKLPDHQPAWSIEKVLAGEAKKSRLIKLMGGKETPAVLFTATHGMGFHVGDPRQLRHQGALLCQEWPGPLEWRESIPTDFYLSAEDITDDAPRDLIAFHFACFSGGTPRLDDYEHQALHAPGEIAPHAFVGALPRRLLGHPLRGALAVVGHVDRAWGYSFLWSGAGPQLQTFDSMFQRLLKGHPVGSAMEYFNQRYADLSTLLDDEIDDIRWGRTPDELGLASIWTARNDARSYVVIGDPAVRVRVETPDLPTFRAAMESIRLPEPIQHPARQSDPPAAEAELRPRSRAVGPGCEGFGDTEGPMEAVPGTDLSYFLLAYNDRNQERSDHPKGLISKQVLRVLEREPVTDVIVFAHGWQNDIPCARRQYAGWIKTMADSTGNRQRMQQLRPGFRPLLIGVHWPSLPWGDERLTGVSFTARTIGVEELIADFAARLGGTAEVRRHLHTIIAAASTGADPARLPSDVADAYVALDRSLSLGCEGLGAAPGADREPMDPEAAYNEARMHAGISVAVSFGPTCSGAMLAPLRALSFWTMKRRACQVAETAVHSFLVEMMQAVAGRGVRFHLMGHSFGCIVASAAVTGPPGAPPLPQPADSIALVQGAVSLWAYCRDIPVSPGRAGYFHRLIAEGRVRGPIVTTQSRHDRAVGTWYPRGARSAAQIAFTATEFPRYGAIGAFGIQGTGLILTNDTMKPLTEPYAFAQGRVHNLDSSQFICNGGGLSGSHSDIQHPEVAHAIWSAWMV